MDIFFESEYLENLSSRIESFDKSLNYMKEQLTDFTQSSKKNIDQFKINFTYCHVAISKNGGLIAVCKKKGFFDLKRDSKLNKYIIVFFQDLKRKYLISIPWDNNKIYAVCVDFTPKQELFAILNNGEIYKINYNDGKAKRKEKYFSKKLEEEGIIKAKLFEKGFIAYTKFENFYYVKDIKNVEAVLMFSLPMYFKFDQNVDFIAIPADNTNSKRIEVLITRQKYYDRCCYVRFQLQGNMYAGCVGLSEENYLDTSETIRRMEEGDPTIWTREAAGCRVYQIDCKSSYIKVLSFATLLLALIL